MQSVTDTTNEINTCYQTFLKRKLLNKAYIVENLLSNKTGIT